MDDSNSTNKARLIRSFFLHVGKNLKSEKKKKKFHENACEGGLEYIRMRLLIDKITPEFEKYLEQRVSKIERALEIQTAEEEDLDTIKKIYNESWPSTCAPFRPLELEKFEKIFKDDKTVFLIARVDHEEAGFILIDFAGRNDEIALIAGLGIIPKYQREGLGTALGMAAWNYLKTKNVQEILCEVYKGNTTSQKFIETFGFEKVEKRKYGISDFFGGTISMK
ncbi:MAG: GNAT family N-acetyltransferase [Promethearchaeota archaeon]